jgi:hypothetical protein
MFDPPFHSQDLFREAFLNGLSALLKAPDLGSYILVHANARYDEKIYQVLEPLLKKRFDQLSGHSRGALIHGFQMAGSTDDQLVFLKLMAISLEGLHATEFRRLGNWELQFNHIRSFRPARMSRQSVEGISRPFDAEGFHFNRPFLRREVFWQGELLGVKVELLYNKFPFMPLHGLLVPDRKAEMPQLLTRRYHEFIWSLCEILGEQLPGWGVGFNSYGASASVNHLHFQSFIRQRPLPIAESHWQHNGGDQAYPLAAEVFTSVADAWERISQLHDTETPYNLLYLPGRLYCLPRKPQGGETQTAWSSGFAWYELAGGFTTFRHEDFDNLEVSDVESAMGRLAL